MTKEKAAVLFLKEFTLNLIQNSKKERIFIPSFHPVKKISLYHFLPPHPPEQEIVLQESLNIPFTPAVGYVQSKTPAPLRAPFEIPRRIEITEKRMPEVRMHKLPPRFQMPVQPQNPVLQTITPSPQPLPAGFSLGKIDPLIYDNRITTIECPGPGKFILTKTAGNINITRISLGEEEIKIMIQEFSRQAKIPIITGLFKAVVGNLVITAVISDFVGSRFIINKYTPYSLLENSPIYQNQQFPVK